MNDPPRILLIDDDPLSLHATLRLLKKAGYEVIEAATGLDGLRLAQTQAPDLILLDVALSDIDGVELCRRIKADAALATTLVVLFSGHKIESDNRAEGLEHGADGYIVRPISNRELLARVQAILRIKQTEERIKHLNAVLRAIRNVNQLIVREKDHDRLLQGVCDTLVETRGFHSACIVLFDDSGELKMATETGLGANLPPLVERLKRGESVYCTRLAPSQVSPLIVEDPSSTCTDCPVSKNYQDRKGIVVRLEHAGRMYG